MGRGKRRGRGGGGGADGSSVSPTMSPLQDKEHDVDRWQHLPTPHIGVSEIDTLLFFDAQSLCPLSPCPSRNHVAARHRCQRRKVKGRSSVDALFHVDHVEAQNSSQFHLMVDDKRVRVPMFNGYIVYVCWCPPWPKTQRQGRPLGGDTAALPRVPDSPRLSPWGSGVGTLANSGGTSVWRRFASTLFGQLAAVMRKEEDCEAWLLITSEFLVTSSVSHRRRGKPCLCR